MTNLLLVGLTSFSALYLFVTVWTLGNRKPGYRHLKHTISELGEMGAPDQNLVGYGVFLPVGLVTAFVAAQLLQTAPATAALAAALAVGYVGATLFPCDAGAPAVGSLRNGVHMLCGGIEYVGGGFALMVLSESLGLPFRIFAFVVLGGALWVGYAPPQWLRGGVQRVIEAVLFGALMLAQSQ